MKKFNIIAASILLAANVFAAEKEVTKQSSSFLDSISLTTEGFYLQNLSDGGGQWGAGSTVGLKLNKNVTLNVRNLAYETENWGGGPAIDESQAGFAFQLLTSKKLTLNGEVDYVRNWNTDDNGIGVGGNLSWAFTKRVSAFGGVQFRVWNKGNNDILYPFGIKFSF